MRQSPSFLMELMLHGEVKIVDGDTIICRCFSCGGWGEFMAEFPDGTKLFSTPYAERVFKA